MKTKLSYLPVNLFWCMSSFLCPYIALTTFAGFQILPSILISFYIYYLDVKSQTLDDYLSDKIKALEDKQDKIK